MSSAPTTPSFPLVRECPPGGLRPLLVPGGRDNYFSVELQRMMFAGDEPLARFLPPAKWQMADRSDRSRHPQITYIVPDEIIKTARPLTTLPQTEIDAFVQAVTVFAGKGRPNATGVTPFLPVAAGSHSGGISSAICSSCSSVATLSMPPGIDLTTGEARKSSSTDASQPFSSTSSSA